MNFTVELPPPDGKDNVIVLSVIRESRNAKRIFKKCQHHRCTLDTALTKLTCNDCKAELSPIEWIVMMTEDWQHVQYLHRKYSEMLARYEGKKRCRCEHCGKLTNVKPMSAAEVRALRPKP